MNRTKLVIINILLVLTALATIFHLLILIKFIPYEITWGGKLKTDREMYIFESISILINLFYMYLLAQKGGYLGPLFGPKSLSILLWIFFIIFSLNTIGNVFAKTNLEKGFALLTLTNAVCLWILNKNTIRKELLHNQLPD